ncbi:hypothetical protein I302_102355 [Kwoniella bestiolae CBS 10118]|uniref:Cytoplasmic tRNA 2-thiolation protein 2 n=1 Tax=Kwoniella bestiolae CBS 10118 TaxID=1296100 RepID=A0A1B9GET6_9TREE|nr:hypothetical protein I302_01048 [Kwoniella bestiolae CBS 10118]OCF29540.1 hypothetical protein I302_01048 [Kwoniella bestiolae CBS 10118]
MSCGDIPDGLATEEQGEALMPRRVKVQRFDKSKCQKCRTAKSMYIIRNVTYCKECFSHSLFTRLTRTLHPAMRSTNLTSSELKNKSLASIGGNRPLPQGGSVLIGLSGGSSSIALLDILVEREYIGKGDGRVIDRTKGEKQPVWDRGIILHVDFSDVIENPISKEEDRSEELKKWVEGKGNGLVWVGLKAEDVYDGGLRKKIRGIVGLPKEAEGEERVDGDGVAVDLKNPDLPLFPSSSSSSSTPIDQLRSILSALPAASRPSFLSSILDSLITTTSQIIPDTKHILLAETSTRQAQRLIAGTALGKGYTLPLDLSVINKSSLSITDGSKRDIVRLKPMKDISFKEVAIYTHLRGLNGLVRNARNWDNAGPQGRKGDSRGKGNTRSLESLTEQFIASLAVTHPATVSTINRTGDKLRFTGVKEDEVTCPVCQLPVDPNALEWKSRTALTSLPTKTLPQDIGAVTNGVEQGKDKESLAKMLCYACLTTFTPPTVVSKVARTEVVPIQLPLWVGGNVRDRRREMREEIKGFLIDEE